MRVPSAHTTKLSDRSKLVVHLGKEPGTKAYRLYDPISGVVHVSRDVIFEKGRTWMWEKQQEQSSTYGGSFIVMDSQMTGGIASSDVIYLK